MKLFDYRKVDITSGYVADKQEMNRKMCGKRRPGLVLTDRDALPYVFCPPESRLYTAGYCVTETAFGID